MPPPSPFARVQTAAAPQASTPSPGTAAASFDQMATRRIDGIRAKHLKIRDIRVRAEADERRFSVEHDEAVTAITATYGRKDPEELTVHIEELRAVETRKIDDYEAIVTAAEEKLRILGELV